MLSDAEGQALSSVATLEPGQDIHIRVADGRIGATTTKVDRIDLMPDTDDDSDTEDDMADDDRADSDELTYEEARDRLIEVVRTLEQGGTSLAESLALWEQGEELAKVCQRALEGARARLDKALDEDADQATSYGPTAASVVAELRAAPAEFGCAGTATAGPLTDTTPRPST